MKKLNKITKGETVEILNFADHYSKCSSGRLGLAIGQIRLNWVLS